MKKINKSEPDQSRMLLYFAGGSMVVLLVCLTIVAGFLGFSFLQKEKQSAQISKDQIEHFFEFHHTAMSEEMWTGSLKPIANRIALIANQLGGATFSLVLTDEKGKCLLSQKQSKIEEACKVPVDMQALVQERTLLFSPKALLRFDETTQNYVYMVPLAIGETLRGFLYVKLSDPYDFYRGSIVSVTGSTFLPILAVILFIWVLWLFASREFFLNPYLRYVNEMKADERFADQARSSAHDLRDPISGLEKCVKRLNDFIPQDEQGRMQSFLFQMEDVANNLLSQSSLASQNANGGSVKPSPEPLFPIIERIVSRKKVQYNAKHLIEIRSLRGMTDWKMFGNIVERDFERLLSNLINNAVEAIEREGNVTVEMQEESKFIAIEIRDTGRGIPEEVIPKLGQRGFTYGKKNGNGLGLHYAKMLVESWGGSLTVDSTMGSGTTVRLLVPRVEKPKWFPAELKVSSGTSVIVLDDQPHAHELWDERFKSFRPSGITLRHFSKTSDFLNWHSKPHLPGPVLYLFDYELKGERQTGFDIIDEFELYEDAVLVTSYCDESLRALCERTGVKLLPKNVAGFIPLICEGDLPLREVL